MFIFYFYQLMDQLSATIDSKESFLSKTDFEIMFFKISEILSLHQTCVKQLAPKVQNWQNNETVGTILKELVSLFFYFWLWMFVFLNLFSFMLNYYFSQDLMQLLKKSWERLQYIQIILAYFDAKMIYYCLFSFYLIKQFIKLHT